MAFIVFGSLTTAHLGDLDTDFATVAQMAATPCGVTGTNVLSLTPATNVPVVASYVNYQTFYGVAAATNTGSVTAGVGALATLNVYKDTGSGPVLLSGAEIVAKNGFTLIYDSALNSGSGGFHLQTGIATASGTFLPLTGGTLSGSLTLTSLHATGAISAGSSITATGLVSGASLSSSGVTNSPTVVIGGGTPIRNVLSTVATVNFSTLAFQATQDQQVLIPSANVNDTVMLGLPSLAVAGVVYNAFVAASGTVTVRAANITTSGCTPTGGNLRLTLMQF